MAIFRIAKTDGNGCFSIPLDGNIVGVRISPQETLAGLEYDQHRPVWLSVDCLECVTELGRELCFAGDPSCHIKAHGMSDHAGHRAAIFAIPVEIH